MIVYSPVSAQIVHWLVSAEDSPQTSVCTDCPQPSPHSRCSTWGEVNQILSLWHVPCCVSIGSEENSNVISPNWNAFGGAWTYQLVPRKTSDTGRTGERSLMVRRRQQILWFSVWHVCCGLINSGSSHVCYTNRNLTTPSIAISSNVLLCNNFTDLHSHTGYLSCDVCR